MAQNDSYSAYEADVPERRGKWVYGFNVALLVVIATVLIGVGLYLSSTVKAKADLTTNKIYSLSDYTQKLIKQIDDKGEKYELVSLYPGTESGQRVNDLLDEYARYSKNITVQDFATVGREALDQKIRDRYASDIKPYEEAVGQFKKISDDLEKFAKTEGANLAGVSQDAKTSTKAKRELLELQGFFATQLPEALGRLKKEVNQKVDSTATDWSRLTTRIKTIVDSVESQVALLSNTAQAKELMSPETVKYLESQGDRYKALDDGLKKYVGTLDKLQPLKMQDVLEGLTSRTVVVLGPKSVEVIPDWKMFKDAPPAAPGAEQPVGAFEGEQAVSSVLLGMVQPEKVKVVFVNSGQPLTTTQAEPGWSGIADRLKAMNFDVQEWSPMGKAMQPGMPPEPAGPPPAEGKGCVWIVFPPDAPNPQQMMMGMPPPDPTPLVDAVKKHMAAGGQVMILAEAGGSSPVPGMGGEFPFKALTDAWGVDVETQYTVVKRLAGPDGQSAVVPRVEITRYSDHAITKPLQALKSIFAGFSQGRGGGMVGGVTPVAVKKELPAGVEAQAIVETPADPDTWGETAFAPDAKFDADKDAKAPLPLMVAATKNKGKEDEQRMVVIGSKMIGINYLADMQTMRQSEEGIVVALEYPGNSELVTNSVLWLAGYKNMIAVSSKATAAMRIKDISPAMLGFWRGMLWGGLPVLSLVLGGVVWLFRRR